MSIVKSQDRVGLKKHHDTLPIVTPIVDNDAQLYELTVKFKAVEQRQDDLEALWIEAELEKANILKTGHGLTSSEGFERWAEETLGLKSTYAYNWIRVLERPDLVGLVFQTAGKVKVSHIFALLSAPVSATEIVKEQFVDEKLPNPTVKKLEQMAKDLKKAQQEAEWAKNQAAHYQLAIDSEIAQKKMLEAKLQETTRNGKEERELRQTIELKEARIEELELELANKPQTATSKETDIEDAQYHRVFDAVYSEKINEYYEHLADQVLDGIQGMNDNLSDYNRTQLNAGDVKDLKAILKIGTRDRLSQAVEILSDMSKKLDFLITGKESF